MAGGTSFRMCIETFVDIIRRPLWRQPSGGNLLRDYSELNYSPSGGSFASPATSTLVNRCDRPDENLMANSNATWLGITGIAQFKQMGSILHKDMLQIALANTNKV